MKKYILLLLVSSLFSQTELHKQLYTFLDYYNNNGLEINFEYNLDSKYFSKQEKCNIKIDNKSQFVFEMGPKKLFYNGIDFRTYDNRTNQLFIQNPDSSILESIKFYLDKNYILSLVINQIDSNNFKINTDQFIIELIREKLFYNGIFKYDNNLIRLNNILIKEYKDSIDYFNLEKMDMFIIDMRTN